VSTILVVDDEKPLREMLAAALEEAGYRVFQAFHGRGALDVIAAERPDLVVSDIMMPLMNGVELCRTLKGNGATAQIPVILMSAAGKSAAEGAGADAYSDKPFDLDVLEALVRHWLTASGG
jgi:two-component system, OmpR family, phosphate regulon response regulator PhoB